MAVPMPTITENPSKFIQVKTKKKKTLHECTLTLHCLSAVLPIARDGHLR